MHNKRGYHVGSAAEQRDLQPLQEGNELCGNPRSDNDAAEAVPGFYGVQVALE